MNCKNCSSKTNDSKSDKCNNQLSYRYIEVIVAVGKLILLSLSLLIFYKTTGIRISTKNQPKPFIVFQSLFRVIVETRLL